MRSARCPQPPRHLLVGLSSVGLVLLVHGWLLAGLPRAPGPWHAQAVGPPRALQVRQIVPAAAAVLPTAALPVVAAVPVPPSTRPRSVARQLPRPAPAPAAPAAAAMAVTSAPAVDVAAAAGPAEPPSPAPLPASQTPVYATRLAPPATLHYALRRGPASGRAVLHWTPDAGRYALSLHGQLVAAAGIARVSQGAIDAHGIAPDRYSESRRGREVRAANFQRERARITFSGPQVGYALPPGAQDRLSWMLQLGAVMAADAGLESGGEPLQLFVVGSRGDAEAWAFTVQGRQRIQLPTGEVDTVHLRREPRREYDTLVEVWLDPARHHLPVRARLSVRGDSTEFVLEQLTLP